MRALLGLLLALLWGVAATAQERITDYAVDIVVEPSGELLITETIDVVSEGDQIQRGIFRELIARYTFLGVSQPYTYDLLEVTRNGERERVTQQRNGNAIVWRIGRADHLLEPGPHRYEIRYRVDDQIRRHRDPDDAYGLRDELWWNPVGTYWTFPIERARVSVRFPDGADVIDTTVFTGRRGQQRQDAIVEVRGSTVTVETAQPLPPRNGLNISLSVAPGVIAPMSAERQARLFWIRWGAPILLGFGGLGILAFYFFSWNRVGRDPQKPPVFPRYEPPTMKNGRPYSPAAVHYIHHKGFRDMDAFSAMLMQLGAKGVVDIEADKKRTVIRQTSGAVDHPDARALLSEIMAGRRGVLELDGGTDTKFFAAIAAFHQTIARAYGPAYYKRNLVLAVLGLVLSVALAAIVIASPVAKNGPVVLALFAGIAAMNLLFAFLLPAPTKRGAQVSSEIDGFELYLKTAEEKRINTANPLGDRPPAMTTELYERFLPYAMALGVEKPWTKQFESSLPREAAEYRPSYARGNAFRRGRGPIDFSRTLGKTLTAGVAAAAPVSQS
ncbi:MAG: DUF2207 domain-containing protein, partial [Litorimonas sp.]